MPRSQAGSVTCVPDVPDVAATAALLEIGDRLGVLPLISDGACATADGIAESLALPLAGVRSYLEALWHAGLVEQPDGAGEFRAVADFETLRYEAGYVSWTMNANRPFIEHASEFLTDFEAARVRYRRDMRHVAVSSQWMGSRAFYPEALETILAARPRRLVDLGAGSARLLIETLTRFPGSSGLALDLAPEACAEARRAAAAAEVADRLTVVERSIQSVAGDPGVLAGADLIHAGFVFHDMFPDEEEVADRVLRNCREALGEGGRLVVTEAVPYVDNDRERRFSAIVTYFHHQFMGRRLLDEREWKAKLAGAGFTSVTSRTLRFPTGRQFIATGG